MVEKQDIRKALGELGITETDTVIFHSSLKSFGRVDGGAETVIEAVKEHLCKGTTVFPALRSRDFLNAYKDWNIATTPSDVGLISETFRKQQGVLRSDQETHSVCACGVNAQFLTEGHKTGKPRIGVFGDYAFGHHSPWQKLYDLDGKVVMLGVTLVYNTMKHLAEYMLLNDVVDAISDETVKAQAIGKIARFSDQPYYAEHGDWGEKMWPFHDGLKAQTILTEKGLCRSATCGESVFVTVNAREFVRFMYDELLYRPEEWVSDACVSWIRTYAGVLK